MENEKPKLTLADFKQSAEFLTLTDQQRKFVLRYFQDRDAAAAAAVAYPTSRNPRQMKNTLLGTDSVLAAINLWYGVTPKAAMIAAVKRDIRRTRSERVRFDLKVLLCRLQGLIQ